MATHNREKLGQFMNVVCFQYLRITTEDVAGRAPIITAGRKRGYDSVTALGLAGQMTDADTICAKLDEVFGLNGTRLCIVEAVTPLAEGGYEVRISESACTAGQSSEEPLCAFTLGVFIGAIHALTGQPMSGHETQCQACSTSCEGSQCIYHIKPI